MTTATKPKSGFEKWQDGLNKAVDNAEWDVYDCNIQTAVNAFNRHLAGTAGYFPLDWQLIKAMMWVETGAGKDLWKSNPMQIGMPGDPGLRALLSDKEGGHLIVPPSLQPGLNVVSATSMPTYNIRAGIGYLLMRMANFEIKSVPDADTKTYEVTVKAGDSFDRIAKVQGSTIESLKKLNPTAHVLRPGQVLKYQKAAMKKVIVRWKHLTTSSIAIRYNVGDPLYAKKLDYALLLMRKGKVMACTP